MDPTQIDKKRRLTNKLSYTKIAIKNWQFCSSIVITILNFNIIKNYFYLILS
jgi:hypothetical protein